MTRWVMPMAELMKNVTMHIEITQSPAYRLRRWMALRLIRLAARLLGCNIEVSYQDRKKA